MEKITPFVRYALLILAGMAARGGWLPEHIGEEIANDPMILEVLTGAIMAGFTLVWYLVSLSRKALREVAR